jgi:flagellar biosynthesis protein FlhF
MRIRTFLAKDMKEALATMRAALGDDAIIVASERLKDGSLCLRAGVEEIQQPPAAESETVRRASSDEALGSPLATFEDRYRDGLLARLRAPTLARANRSIPFDRADLLRLLLAHRTPEAIASALADKAEKSGLEDMTLALASALDKTMRTETTGKAILLTGPPGSGKTAVAAKLAAQSLLAYSPVVLVATDLEAAGQAERLETFAACLDLPISCASEADALTALLERAHQEQSLLIADSAACDPREPLAPELLRFLAIGQIETTAVLSAAMDAEEAAEIARAFAQLGVTKLIVTGLDLTRRKGTLVALAASGLAIGHVTASPYLAAGLETLTPLALSRILTGSAVLDTRQAA